MPEQEWAKEPLDWDSFDNDKWDTTLNRFVINEATKRRISACYNACAGVPTEVLEAWAQTIDIVRFIEAENIEGYVVKLHIKDGASEVQYISKENNNEP